MVTTCVASVYTSMSTVNKSSGMKARLMTKRCYGRQHASMKEERSVRIERGLLPTGLLNGGAQGRTYNAHL